MKRVPIIATIILSIALLMTCKKENDTPIEPVIPCGTVVGKVLAENGKTPIPGATVFIDINGEVYLTESDVNGNFTLQAPVGQRVLNVQTGAGRIFRTQFNVQIAENQTTTIPSGTLKLLQTQNLAYIVGQYDNIQAIIVDSLGYAATEITLLDLDNLTTMEQYGAIFLNCGKQGLLSETKYQNLLAFVQNGGSLYASDWAIEYLTGDGNYKTQGSSHQYFGAKYACPVGPVGGFIDDADLCAEKTGTYTTVYGAQVAAQDLSDYLGTSNIDIAYDLGGWEVIKNISSSWEILIQDNNEYGVLAARYYVPSSTKYVKSMLEQGWVTICHIPPGNPANAHTITISINALPAHLAHGDYEGSCENTGMGGVIYYTTFHNEVQHNISSDVQKVLQYFILNM